ncbi:hypothetical protein L195_g028699 [Trifolium pratense]|uniref:Uncharacterized protein n=1 Tax=Trifolium pratense TaxID=57577 RepID=A0A2K3L2P3_TRIPR|nr:hypothetical protein L195_g028699 [Trifolium pratense]
MRPEWNVVDCTCLMAGYVDNSQSHDSAVSCVESKALLAMYLEKLDLTVSGPVCAYKENIFIRGKVTAAIAAGFCPARVGVSQMSLVAIAAASIAVRKVLRFVVREASTAMVGQKNSSALNFRPVASYSYFFF